MLPPRGPEPNVGHGLLSGSPETGLVLDEAMLLAMALKECDLQPLQGPCAT
jgi:hypothetical protein